MECNWTKIRNCKNWYPPKMPKSSNELIIIKICSWRKQNDGIIVNKTIKNYFWTKEVKKL